MSLSHTPGIYLFEARSQEAVSEVQGPVGALIEEGKGINKFDGEDFRFWKIQIEDYLYVKKMHLPLLGRKPETMTDEDWALLDRQVLGVIRSSLSRSVALNVVNESTTVGVMSVLSGIYEKPSTNKKLHLMKKLINLKMSENSGVAQHLNVFNTIISQLSAMEINFDDEIQALLLLASLPNSWEAMRIGVSNSIGKDKLKFVDLRDLILNEEVHREDSGEASTSNLALNVEANGKDSTQGSGHGRFRSRHGKSRSRNPKNSSNS